MTFGVDLFHALCRDVCIDLCRDEVGVAEKLLDRADVRAVVQQVRGKGVPHRMRGCLETFGSEAEILVECAAYATVGETPTEFVEENGRIRLALIAGRQFRTAVAQIVAHHLYGDGT